MKIRGNNIPPSVSLEFINKKAEVRVRENVSEIIVIDTITNEETTMYEYDEYSFSIDYKEGLKEEIESKLEEWLITGRNLEVSPQASLYVSAKADAIDEYTEELMAEGLL